VHAAYRPCPLSSGTPFHHDGPGLSEMFREVRREGPPSPAERTKKRSSRGCRTANGLRASMNAETFFSPAPVTPTMVAVAERRPSRRTSRSCLELLLREPLCEDWEREGRAPLILDIVGRCGPLFLKVFRTAAPGSREFPRPKPRRRRVLNAAPARSSGSSMLCAAACSIASMMFLPEPAPWCPTPQPPLAELDHDAGVLGCRGRVGWSPDAHLCLPPPENGNLGELRVCRQQRLPTHCRARSTDQHLQPRCASLRLPPVQ